MSARRSLLRSTARIGGVGIHTGRPSWVQIHPTSASAASGIRFRSTSGAEAALAPSLVVDTRRCTVIDVAGIRFSTVEHLLSALVGLGITDAVVEFDGPEAPILDGSAAGYCAAVVEAGLTEPFGTAAPATVCAPVDIVGAHGERIVALPSDRLRVTVVVEYPDRLQIGVLAATFAAGDDYSHSIAPARTYGFLSELEQMRAAGLAIGVSQANCIALADDGGADPRTPLRFPNELARHKLLDLIGDLAVVGRPVEAHVVALRPGHAVNSALAARLAAI